LQSAETIAAPATKETAMSKGTIFAIFKLDPLDDGVNDPFIFAAFRLEDFDVGSAAPKIFHEVFLGHYAKIMNDIPGSTFDILGTASRTGSAAFNKALSQHRADNVRDELVAFGVDKGKIKGDIGLGTTFSADPILEDPNQRGVDLFLQCPASSNGGLIELQATWDADPLKIMAAPK
jgi:hypothetical protein